MGRRPGKNDLDAIKNIVADFDREMGSVYKNLGVSKRKRQAKAGTPTRAAKKARVHAASKRDLAESLQGKHSKEACECPYCMEMGSLVDFRKKVVTRSRERMFRNY